MTNRRNRLLAAPLLALLALLAFAGPASASGESVGSCMAEKLEELIEESHGDLEEVLHELHVDTSIGDHFEKNCIEAPSPILPETNEIIWGGSAFLILFVLMVKKGFPAVRGAMDARAEKIRSDLDAAEQARVEPRSLSDRSAWANLNSSSSTTEESPSAAATANSASAYPATLESAIGAGHLVDVGVDEPALDLCVEAGVDHALCGTEGDSSHLGPKVGDCLGT